MHKTLDVGAIVLDAADILVYALVIIVGQFSSLFDQMHKTLDVGAIVLDAFVITLSAVNIVIGSKGILLGQTFNWANFIFYWVIIIRHQV